MTFSISSWSEGLICLTNKVGTEDFFPELQKLLSQVCDFDEMAVFEFSSNSRNKLLFHSKQRVNDDLSLYLDTMYLLDPFFNKGKKGYEGIFKLSDIAPEEMSLFDDYYQQYFRHLKYADELGYLITNSTRDSFYHIELAQFENSRRFTSEETEVLSNIFISLKRLLLQHGATPHREQAMQESSFIEDFYRLFGTDVLTPREQDVSLLMLQGYPVKSIATMLSIGVETVKMHRKRIYSKLTIGSQSEYLALFIDLMFVVEPPLLVDPLTLFLKQKKHAA